MHLRRAWLAAAAFLAVQVGTARAVPLETYGRLPTIETMAISPDGSRLAMVVTLGEYRRLVVERLADAKVLTVLGTGKIKVRGLQWAGGDHLLLTQSRTFDVMDLEGPKREYYGLSDIAVSTGKVRPLMNDVDRGLNVIVGDPVVRTIDGKPTVFVAGEYFPANVGRHALYRIDLETGRPLRIDDRSEDAEEWLIGADGAPAARSDYNERSGKWTLNAHKGSNWQDVATGSFSTGAPDLEGFSADGESAVAGRYPDKEDAVAYTAYPLAGGQATDMPEHFTDAIVDPDTSDLIGFSTLAGDDLTYHFFNPQTEAIWRGVAKAYAGERVELVSWSRDWRKIVVHVSGPGFGEGYGLVDLDAKTAAWLGDTYDGLGPEDIAEVRPVTYKTADGLEIHGYLTLPKGKDPKNLPLVVFPHGGPAARDEPGFDWWAQAMASRGYAVLQPNYRGSSGYGWKFFSEGFGQWGRKMQTDLSDGVRYLAGQGIIDPKRVCIVGASYGGYAALAGATLDPDVYRCAASISGPSDLHQMLLDQSDRMGNSRNSVMRWWTELMGVKGMSDPELSAISPARHADAVKGPVLLIHGKDDTVVNFVQSQIMADALKKAGKPVTFVTLAKEDHWLSRSETRLQMLQAVVGFLETNNPPN